MYFLLLIVFVSKPVIFEITEMEIHLGDYLWSMIPRMPHYYTCVQRMFSLVFKRDEDWKQLDLTIFF